MAGGAQYPVFLLNPFCTTVLPGVQGFALGSSPSGQGSVFGVGLQVGTQWYALFGLEGFVVVHPSTINLQTVPVVHVSVPIAALMVQRAPMAKAVLRFTGTMAPTLSGIGSGVWPGRMAMEGMSKADWVEFPVARGLRADREGEALVVSFAFDAKPLEPSTQRV